jgi:transcriptional regulator with XRE-family HTH domain
VKQDGGIDMADQHQRSFGETLAFYRKRNGWTLKETAERIGITMSGYARYEGGVLKHTKPLRDTVIKYAKAIDPDAIDDFLVAAGYAPGYKENILSPVANWRLQRLRPERIQMVEDTIEFLFKTDQKAGLLKPEEKPDTPSGE